MTWPETKRGRKGGDQHGEKHRHGVHETGLRARAELHAGLLEARMNKRTAERKAQMATRCLLEIRDLLAQASRHADAAREDQRALEQSNKQKTALAGAASALARIAS